MAAILGKALEAYNEVFEELPDPRTKGWLFIAKPYQPLTLIFLYLMFVFKWGPNHMKNRPPYNLDKVLIAYNALQVVACTFLFVKGLTLAWGWDYKWVCEPVDYSNDPKALEIAGMVYFYFLLKVLDLLDTIFFVLRKKFNQISFLHIYHHVGMCVLIWGAVTYLPGGHGTLIGVINSFVHVVMYSYYLLSVAIPSVKNAIWIKKFVTQLQIVQFFWCVVHMTTIVFKPDCEFPRWTSAMFIPQDLFMLVLFIDFYIKTYIKKPKKQLSAQRNTNKVVNQNNDEKSNDILNNDRVKAKFEINTSMLKNKKMNDAKNLKNDLSKLINSSDVSYKNNSNEFSENVIFFENDLEKCTCGSGKSKINCYKHYKNE